MIIVEIEVFIVVIPLFTLFFVPGLGLTVVEVCFRLVIRVWPHTVPLTCRVEWAGEWINIVKVDVAFD